MIDHVYISVTNIEKSLAFYEEALKPLGWSPVGNYDSASGPERVPDLYGIGDDLFGSGKAVGSSIWLRERKLGETGLYVGIVCDTNELVDAAYAAAIKAGGTDEGEPADRTYFASGYYAANVADFDGTVLSSSTRRGTPGGTHSEQKAADLSLQHPRVGPPPVGRTIAGCRFRLTFRRGSLPETEQ